MMTPIRARSYRRAGRLIPRRTRGLRAAAVVLRPGTAMDWHSTRAREELLIGLQGRVVLEVCAGGHVRRRPVRAGQCAWLPAATEHRVVNRSRMVARYVYVTGSAT